MAFLRSVGSFDAGPSIFGDGVFLRTPQIGDFQSWSALREKSRAFLTPWEPSWPQDDLTRSAFRRRLKRYQRDLREDLAYPFFIFDAETDNLAGGVTLSNVKRGVAQSASVGYWAGQPYSGKGYLTRAMRCLIPFAFDSLRLHRLEAACLPSNDASISLLKRCGFVREGYARSYLCINGIWQDHLLFGLLRDDTIG